MATWLLPLLLAAAPYAPDAGAAEPPGKGPSGATAEVRAQPAPDGPTERHIDWLVVPIAKFDPDAKFGYGGAAQLQGAGGVEPYRYQLTLQVLFTTAGVQSHYLRYDAPHFLGSNVRVLGRLEYYRQKFAPYYGLGNNTSDLLTDHPGIISAHPFRWDQEIPNARLGARIELGGPVYAFGFGSFRDVRVRAYNASLLAAEHPYGMEGGGELMVLGGVQYDTRDNEAVPTEGHLFEVSARGCARGAGSAYTFGGVNAKVLQFVTLAPGLTAAFRLEGDAMSHGAPFYDLASFSGFDLIDGVGGEYSARGIPQDRYIGQFKALGTFELRTRLADMQAFGGPLAFGSVAFVDLGRVWQPGERRPSDGAGIHPGYGGGLRLWRRAFVLRADLASSPDRFLSMYLVFGHFF